MPKPSPNPKPSTAKPRKPKKRRRLILWLLGTPIVLVLIFGILGATGALTGLVVPIIERQIGLEMTQGKIVFLPTTEIELRDAVFRAPDIDGPGGEVIRLDRAAVSVRWGSIFKGSEAISGVMIEHPRLRVSQDTATGTVNLDAFNLQQSGGGGAATPAITIYSGVIEVGEHTGKNYTKLKELSVVGNLSKPNKSGVAKFNFIATSTLPSMSSGIRDPMGDFQIKGTLSSDGVEGTMTGLTLEDWSADIVPSRVRPIYESLDLTGNLAATKFKVDTKGNPEITLTLEGVDVNLPFDPPAGFAGPERLLRMRSTKGRITFGNQGLVANLTGDLDQLLYQVDLKYNGYSQSSPFTCDLQTKFRIEEGFRPLLFLPERVSSKLERFIGLRADIDARITLDRALSDGNPGPVLVSGQANVSNGSAKYYEFLYPFENIEGTIFFSPDGVEFDNITGTAPTGAQLQARGKFDGLGEDSVVEIIVAVDHLPIDHLLLGAMDDDQRDLVDTLFSEEKYSNLLGSGYLLSDSRRDELTHRRDQLVATIARLPISPDDSAIQDQRAALSAELASANTMLRVPEFDFGGLIKVDVFLRRHPERPEDDRWTTDIEAVIPSAGLVPKQFPLPIVARDVQITISDGAVLLRGGRYDGLSGGWAQVDASFKPREGFDDPQPFVKIKARQIPIDQRLIAAIPGYYDDQPEDQSDITLRRILDRLRMQGVVEADAKIGPGEDGRISYEVEAGVLTGSAHPLSMGLQLLDDSAQPKQSDLGLDSVQLNSMVGTIFVTESLIVVDLNGMMESPALPLAPTPIRLMTQLTLPNQPRFGNIKRTDGLLPFEAGPPPPGPLLYTRVNARGLDLAMPLEHAIAVLSPSFAKRVSQWRTDYDPDGVLDVKATLEGRVGGSLNTKLQLDHIDSMGFTFENHHYGLGSSIGSLEMHLGMHPQIISRGFSIPVQIDQEPTGTLTLGGSMLLATGGRLLELKDEPSLRVSMDKGRLGSPGVRAVVDRMGSGKEGGARNFFEFYGLDGEFDLLIDITPLEGSRFSNAPEGMLAMPPVEIDGSLNPKTLTMQRDGSLLAFNAEQLTGSIRFDGLEGYFDHINAHNEDYSLSINGRWRVSPGSGAMVDLDIGASGDVLGGPMRVILPDTLNRVVDQLEVKSSGGIDLKRLHIYADRLGTNSTSYTIDGDANVIGVDALVGVPITGFDGTVGFDVRSDQVAGGTNLRFELDLQATRMRAGLLRVHNAAATVVNDPATPGVVLVPEFNAGMHGGVISGNAQVRPNDRDVPWYATEIRVSGVRAAPIFDDLFLPEEGLEGPPGPNASRVRSAWNVDTDVSRGVMNADLTLTGPIGMPDERYGRGYARVSGGSIVALPGLINLIEASNLTLPTGSRLNLAEAEMYIDGPTVSFERLSASSEAVEILGYGTMDWISREIDLRFRSRSINQIPVLSELLEGIRDELITIRIAGAPGAITYAPEQFSTTKRLIDSMFGTAETEQERRLREVKGRTRIGSGLLREQQDDRALRPTISPTTSAFSGTQDDE